MFSEMYFVENVFHKQTHTTICLRTVKVINQDKNNFIIFSDLILLLDSVYSHIYVLRWNSPQNEPSAIWSQLKNKIWICTDYISKLFQSIVLLMITFLFSYRKSILLKLLTLIDSWTRCFNWFFEPFTWNP